MNKTRNNSNGIISQRGFSLVEVVVGSAIIAGVLLSVMITFLAFMELSRYSVERTQAVYLAEEAVEAVRYLRNETWNNIDGLANDQDYWLSFVAGTWELDPTATGLIDGKFDRRIRLAEVFRDADDKITASGGSLDPETRKLTVTINWSRSGQDYSQSVTTYLANIMPE